MRVGSSGEKVAAFWGKAEARESRGHQRGIYIAAVLKNRWNVNGGENIPEGKVAGMEGL